MDENNEISGILG